MKKNEYFEGMIRLNEAKQADMTDGERRAILSYVKCRKYGTNVIEVDDTLWTREIKDFVETLLKAGVKQFVITGRSTALMEELHEFAKYGCKIKGLSTIVRKGYRWDGTDEEVPGIKIAL